MANPEKPLLVEMPIRVKTYDIDFVGHVNNAVYVRWLEDLRLHLLDTYFPLEPMREQGIAPIIVTTNIHYRQGITLSDAHVHARMWVKEFRLASFFLQAEFLVGDEMKCTAEQRGTFVDQEKMKPIRVPRGLADIFDEHTGGEG